MNLICSVCVFLIIGILVHTSISSGHDFKGFDDTVLFDIKWTDRIDFKDNFESFEQMVVTNHDKSKYACYIPKLKTNESKSKTIYTGPGPLDLVANLFSFTTCSYRIESYWTYEVCHGYYIKQYHEEREGKTSKLQEYYLGKWDKTKTEKLRDRLAEAVKNDEKLQYKKIDGLSLPYLELEMSDGTLCDLIDNQPRRTRILYVCYALGKNEVYSLKEVSTCQYEVIILTPVLCAHPSFRPQETIENEIQCQAIDKAPKKPKPSWASSLKNQAIKLDFETLASEMQKTYIVSRDPKDGLYKVNLVKDGSFAGIMSALDNSDLTKQDFSKIQQQAAPTAPAATSTKNLPPHISTVADTSPVVAFLQGKKCLTGGFGWWKYEFCYGRYVRQFHTDKNGETSVILGFFDEEVHKQWLTDNPTKRPVDVGQRIHLSHYYQGGTMCELTGQKRHTEVKLKCMEGSTSTTAVSLYLMEPKPCEYILGVESPLICDILQKADEFGLMPKENRNTAAVAGGGDGGDGGDTDGKNNHESGVYLGNAVVDDIEVRFEND